MHPKSLFKNQYFFLLCVVFVIASIHFWDKNAALWVHHHLGWQWQGRFSWVSKPGDALYSIVLLVILSALFKWIIKKPLWAKQAFYLLLAIVVSGLICDLFKNICGRARPELLFQHGFYGFYWLKFHARYWSFPSGHSTTISALAVGLAMIWQRSNWLAWLWVFLALIVAISRVLVSAHYPSDVLTGFYLGSFTAIWLHGKFKWQELES